MPSSLRISDQRNTLPCTLAGRMFPVSIAHCPLLATEPLVDPRKPRASAVVVKALQVYATGDIGDILVFLPTQRDCDVAREQTERALRKQNDARVVVFALHGRLRPDEQQRALQPLPGRRKIVYATNLAETSLTIDGVRHVIDSGVENQVTYDSVHGMSVMRISGISKSSAIQRQGRAGRTAPGRCYRLYSEDDFQASRQSVLPEILCKPLGLTILSLALRGVLWRDFDWLDAPPHEDVTAAERELWLLGALKGEEVALGVTDFGSFCVELDLEPRVARIVHKGNEWGLVDAAITVAAVIGVSDTLWWRGGNQRAMNDADNKKDAFMRETKTTNAGDLVPMVAAFAQWEALGFKSDVAAGGLPRISSGEVLAGPTPEPEPEIDDDDDDDIDVSSLLTLANIDQHQRSFAATGVGAGAHELDASFDGAPTSSVPSAGSGSDEDSDSSHGGSSAGDSVASPSVAKAQRLPLAVATRRRRDFCSRHSLNMKSMEFVRAARDDLRRALDRVGSCKPQRKGHTATTEELQKLFLAGHFLNVASRAGHAGSHGGGSAQYDCMEAALMGFVHPGSTVATMARSPQWVAFQTLQKSSRTFLKCCTPCDPTWLPDVASPAYVARFRELRKDHEWQERTLGPLSPSLMHAIFGKRMANVQAVERAARASICVTTDGPSTGLLRLWARRANVAAAEAHVKHLMDQAAASLRQESHEEQIVGTTRAVFGAGGQVRRLLMGSEFISVNLSNLPKGYDEEALKCLLERSPARIPRSAIDALDMRPMATETCARIAFEDPKLAARLVQEVDHEMVAGQVVAARPGGVRAESQLSLGDARMRVTWAIGSSKLCGKVGFRKKTNAATVLQDAAGVARSPQMQALASPGRAISILKSKRKDGTTDDPLNIFIGNLRPDVDEADLCRAFEPFGGGSDGHARVFRKPCTDDDGEGDIFVATLNSLLRSREPDDVVFTTDDLCAQDDLRRGRIVRFKSAALAFSRAEEINLLGLTFNGQPVRAEARVSHTQSVRTELYESLMKEVTAINESAWRDGVQVRHVGGKDRFHKTLRYTITPRTAEERGRLVKSMSECRVAMRNLLTTTLFEHPEKSLLFTVEAGLFMERLTKGKKCGYLHWNKRNLCVRMYGSAEQTAALGRQLTDYIKRQLELPQLELFVPRVFKRQVQSKLRGWTKALVHGGGRYRFDPAQGRLTLRGKAPALQKVKSSLVKSGIKLLAAAEVLARDAAGEAEVLCPLCYCEVEDPTMLQACGHVFCRECLQGQVQAVDASTLPLRCYTEGCESEWVWRDMEMLAERETLEAMMQTSYRSHLAKHSKHLGACFGIDCEQIRPLDGRQTFECDQCMVVYCVDCSEKLGKAVLVHSPTSCAEHQEAVRRVESSASFDIYSMKGVQPCPSCHSPIFKDGGCWHMECTQCNSHYCYGCMKEYQASHTACTCRSLPGMAWGLTAEAAAQGHDCRYVYHHVPICSNPVHPMAVLVHDSNI